MVDGVGVYRKRPRGLAVFARDHAVVVARGSARVMAVTRTVRRVRSRMFGSGQSVG